MRFCCQADLSLTVAATPARARLHELILGNWAVIADAALELAEALGTSAKLSLNLRGIPDIARATKRRDVA